MVSDAGEIDTSAGELLTRFSTAGDAAGLESEMLPVSVMPTLGATLGSDKARTGSEATVTAAEPDVQPAAVAEMVAAPGAFAEYEKLPVVAPTGMAIVAGVTETVAEELLESAMENELAAGAERLIVPVEDAPEYGVEFAS
jgi:hypothetical protein